MLDGAGTLFGLDQDGNEKLQLPVQEVKVNTGAGVISHRHFNRRRLHTHCTVGGRVSRGEGGRRGLAASLGVSVSKKFSSNQFTDDLF